MAADDADELAAWLRLLLTPGVGRDAARTLLAAFGSPQAVFDASAARAPRVSSARKRRAGARRRTRRRSTPRSASCAAWLDERPRRATCLRSATRATRRRCSRPPTRRCCCTRSGRLELLDARQHRHRRQPQPDARRALENARAFAAHLGRAGLTVVSGWRSASTAPRTRARSARRRRHDRRGRHRPGPRLPGARIASWRTGSPSAGLIVSEFALGTPRSPPNFPQPQPHHRRPERAARWWSRRRCSRAR